MAQLNQATADARILGEVLELAAQSTARLSQELEEARKQAAWAEEAVTKRVSQQEDAPLAVVARPAWRLTIWVPAEGALLARLAVAAASARGTLVPELRRHMERLGV